MSEGTWVSSPFRWDGSLDGDLLVIGRGPGVVSVSVEIGEVEKATHWMYVERVKAMPGVTEVFGLQIPVGAWVRLIFELPVGGGLLPLAKFL